MDIEYIKLKNSWRNLPNLEVYLDGLWKENGEEDGKKMVRLIDGQSMSHHNSFAVPESRSLCYYIDLTRRNSSQIIPNKQTSNNQDYGSSNAEGNHFGSTAVFRSQTQNVPLLEVSLVLFLEIFKKDINPADLKFRMN